MNEINNINSQEPKQENKQIKWKTVIIGAIVLAIVLVLTYLFLKYSVKIKFKEILDIAKQVNTNYLLLSFVFFLGYIFFEGRAMASAGKAIGVKMSVWQSIRYASTELYFSALTPSASGGQPVAAYYMSADGIPYAKSSVILINNTLHYISSLIVLGIIATIVRWKFILGMSLAFKLLIILGYICYFATAGACIILMYKPNWARKICVPLISLLNKLRIVKNKEKSIESLENSIGDYGVCQKAIRNNPLAQLKIFGCNIAHRMCNFLVAYGVYKSFGLSEHSVFSIILIQILLVLSVNELPLPGAAGFSEVTLLSLYTHIYPDEAAAGFGMILTRGIGFYLILVICGAISIVRYIVILKRKSEGS